MTPMQRSNQALLTALLLLLAALGAGLAWWSSRQGEQTADSAVVLDRQLSAPSAAGPRPETQLEAVDHTSALNEESDTTVVWPLEVDLTLVQRGTFETPPNVPPFGSGASASLKGGIFGQDGRGQAATVTFVAGPNEGRVLQCDSEGAYGASDLYGGLSVVEIKTPAGRTAQREVLLREFSETPLTIGFGRPASVYGRVLDVGGQPLEGASVTIDGRESFTDAEGVFHFVGVASGRVLAIVRKPGYATYREVIPITAGFTITQDKLTFSLERAAKLQISILEQLGSREAAQVFLIPSGGQRVNTVRGQRTYPWYLVNPVEVYPGGSTLVEDLPSGRVDIVLFHSGAMANPARRSVRLTAGREKAEVLHLEAGRQLRGRVVRGGEPVFEARVSLEAPHRTRATTEALGKRFDFLRGMVLSHVMPARQEVLTDANGEFLLTRFPNSTGAYYLAAETLDSEWIATRTVGVSDEELELELEPVAHETGSLEVGLEGRYQGLPIQVRIQGTPRDKFELAPRRELVIADLEPGTWRLDVSWNGRFIKKGLPVEITPSGAEVEAVLPEGAIHGQNEFERRRAGKDV